MTDKDTILKRYEQCKNYVDTNGLVSKSTEEHNFYIGKQWEGISAKDELPTMNIIKPIVKYNVGTVAQNTMSPTFIDANGNPAYDDLYRTMNVKFMQDWNKSRMDSLIWELLKNACITGDHYIYFGTDKMSDAQLIEKPSILLGNEKINDIQSQPYLFIRERRFVSAIRDEAKKNGIDKHDIDMIGADNQDEWQVNNSQDMSYGSSDGKTTSLIYMEKVDGVVHIAKLTEKVVYKKLSPIEGKAAQMSPKQGSIPLTLYPVVGLSWETMPNDARGVGAVRPIIPNQISLNKGYAQRAIATKLSAFPRVVYNENALRNPEALDMVGVPLAVDTTDLTKSVSQIAAYMQPSQLSPDAKTLTDDLLETTRNLSGSDASITGMSDLSRVAASAVTEVRDQAALSLNEQVERYKQAVEDIARVWLNIYTVYAINGITVMQPLNDKNGKPVMDGNQPVMEEVTITQDQLRDLEADVKVDVSQDTSWTKKSEQEWLDKMLEIGAIVLEEYVELAQDGGVVPKAKMEKILKARGEQPQEELDEMS